MATIDTMRTIILLGLLSLVGMMFSGCGENPCERAKKYVAECLDVTYTPTHCGSDNASDCQCSSLGACQSDCLYHTECEWIVAASQGKSVPGLQTCLRNCALAN